MKAYFSRILSVLAAACSTTSATTRYVDLNCPTPTPPYTNWSTAATTIQDAVDAVKGADLILVTNGVYASGGRSVLGMSNRVAVIGTGITLQSVNGPEQTMIQGCQVPGTTDGPGAVRCAYLDGKVVLSGFTLTNGATLASGDEYNLQSGGGIRAGSQSVVVTNCVMTGNSASWYGGGVYGYGTNVSNRPYAQHAWDVAGDYVVTLTAYNEDHPEGIAASLTMHAQTTPTHFVMLGSINPVAPYQSWDTAAGISSRPLTPPMGPELG